MNESSRSLSIAIENRSTTAVGERVPRARALYVCAHGAGGHLSDRGMERIAEVLSAQAIETVRFNFLYRESGSRRPDAMPLLRKCFEAVVEQLRPELRGRRLLLGGRSMGGRVASMMAADGYPCDGLVLFAYPLHPAGRPEKLRIAHLPKIRVPVLCFNGTRDALCTPELMERALKEVHAPWSMHWLQGADHSFRRLKSSGRSEAQLWDEVGAAARRWLDERFPPLA